MTRRKFTVADGMILIAGSAVGLGLFRTHLVSYYRCLLYQSPVFVYPAWMYRLPDQHQVAALAPLLMAWSLAVLSLQLTKPRLPLRRLVLRPGSASCLATAFGVALWLAVHARGMITNALDPSGPYGFNLWYFDESLPRLVGTSIGATWFALAIGGRWCRQEPDWRGRLGRFLGWSWLLLFLLLNFSLGLLRDR